MLAKYLPLTRPIMSIFICLIPLLLPAQHKPEFEKKPYVDSISGKKYWNKHIPFTVKLIGVGYSQELLLNNTQVSEVYMDTEGMNTVYSPWLVDPETKQYILPKTDVEFIVYADGLSPVSMAKYQIAKRHDHQETTFFGKGLRIELSAKDGMSGVQNTYYSLNKEAFKVYAEPLTLNDEGKYLFQYFSVDNVGNVEKEGIKKFVVDTSAPKTYHSITDINANENIIAVSTKISLDAEDAISKVKASYYSIDDNPKQKYTGGFLQINNLSNGNHDLQYFSVDIVGNTEPIRSFPFYLDRQAPILSSDVLGDRYIVNDQIYFSGRTKMKLTAIDNKSGVKDIMFSINGGEFSKYTEPFYLPSKQGLHILRFYATDQMENSTGRPGHVPSDGVYEHAVVKRIFTDLIGPSISHRYSGTFFEDRDTVFVSKQTKLHLSAKDEASGLQYIAYSIDGKQEETSYKTPFSLEKPGLHKIEVFAYDNVNNRNKKTIFCFLDNLPPLIQHTFSIPSKGTVEIDGKTLDAYPSYVNIFLAASDNTVGADKIMYQINGNTPQRYVSPITGFAKGKANTLSIVAFDKLGNQSKTEIVFFIN